MAAPLQPTDGNGDAIPVLALGSETATLNVGAASSRTILPTDTIPGDVVRIACTTDCRIAFGTSGVTASGSSPLFLSGVEVVKVPRDATHIAAIRLSADGAMTITEMV